MKASHDMVATAATLARRLPALVLGALLAVAGAGTTGCVVATDEEDVDEAGVVDEAAEWNKSYEEQSGGKADAPSCSGVVVPDRSGFGKRVALTFDDGPNPTTTPQVLDILAKYDIKATFFMNGSRLGGTTERQIVARMVAEGHFAGNHSQTHQNLKEVSATRLEQEISLTHQALINLGVTPRYFRFPFGSAGCTAAERVRAYGYAITGWHIDSADWCFASGGGTCPASTFRYVDDAYRSDMAGYVLSQARSVGGGVLLFHDIHQNTVNNLENIIVRLKNDGFTFVNLDDTNTFPLLNGATPVFVGDSCDDGSDCSFTSNGFAGECLEWEGADAGYCTVECQGYCDDRPGKAPTFCTSLDDGQSGTCVPKSDAANQFCAGLPGTVPVSAARFIGTSGASAATATVCLPE